MNGIYITWSNLNTRSEIIATYFGLEPINFHHLRTHTRSVPLAILRYAWLSLYTFAFLSVRRPDVVFSVNLPVVAPILIVVWARLFRKKVVIDNHSGLFVHRAWKWTLPFAKHFFRRATLCLVTNEEHKQLIERWGGRAAILGALVLPSEIGSTCRREIDATKVTFVASFFDDEPIEQVIQSARLLPDFSFFITGSLKNAKPEFLQNVPPNVVFTDFLPRESFVALVKSSMCTLVLVTDDNTMQRGAYESMSFETPVITSRWPILESAFPKGALFVDNSVAQITSAIRTMAGEHNERRREIIELKYETHAKVLRAVDAMAMELNEASRRRKTF